MIKQEQTQRESLIKEALSYDAASLEKDIEIRLKNIKAFEQAITKEEEAISKNSHMLEIIKQHKNKIKNN